MLFDNVIPAQAGIQGQGLDSRLRGSDNAAELYFYKPVSSPKKNFCARKHLNTWHLNT